MTKKQLSLEEKIYNLLRESNGLTRAEIANELSISEQRVSEYVAKMKRNRRLKEKRIIVTINQELETITR